MSTGELLTRWTVRLALALYVATIALRLAAPRRRSAARLAWTAGCLLFLTHVALAFHVFHGWSHADALAVTARRTRALTGARSGGGGLYLNYLFTLLWALDAAWWWGRGLAAYERRPPWVGVALHAFFAFMAINATVVFERGPTRWAGVLACVLLPALWWFRRGVARR